MPKIPTYESRVSPAGPVDYGGTTLLPDARSTDSGIGAAYRGLGQQFSEAGAALQRHAERVELSSLNADISSAQAKLSNDWQEALRTADPNDDKLAERFLESFDEQFDGLSQRVSTGAGQRYLQVARADLRANFERTAVAGQAELAGVKAVQDYTSSLNNHSNTLLNDPSQFQISYALHATGLNNLVETSGLPRHKAIELKIRGDAALAESTIRGWIQKDEKYAKVLLDEGAMDSFFSGDVKRQLYGEIKSKERELRVDRELQRQEEERALKLRQTAVQNEFLNRLAGDGPPLTQKDVNKSILDPTGGGSKVQFLNMLEEKAKGKIESDPRVKIDVWNRIHNLPQNDPRRITQESQLYPLVGKGLDIDDVKTFQKELLEKGSFEGTVHSEMKAALIREATSLLAQPDKFTGFQDPNGVKNLNKFLSYVSLELEEARKQGKPVRPLLDANSPEYLGKKILSYRKTISQINQERIAEQKLLNLKAKGQLTPVQIMQLNEEELSKLSPKGLTKEQLDAARKRYNELHGGKQ